MDKHTATYLGNIEKRFLKDGEEHPIQATNKTSYFLMVLGFGLGYQIEDLLEKTQAKVLFIFEPNIEFLYHSLFVFDWTSLLEKLENKKIELEFLISKDPAEIANGLGGCLRKYNPSGVDGTFLYTHYASAIFNNAIKDFYDRVLKVALMGLGFFEDELHMVMHSYDNLKYGKHRVLRAAKPNEVQQLPVFIIGNGPSLDQHIDYIRANMDKAFVIACGTAIDALLENDIKPDMVIQIERSAQHIDLFKYTAENHDISGICMLASSTVYKDIIDLFDDTIFFFRPGLTSYPVFALSHDQILKHPDPSVTNTGLAFAQQLRFREYYLFGCDVGTKDPEYHHSKDSLYAKGSDEHGADWFMNEEREANRQAAFKHEIPGNFGGVILSDGLLLWTKQALENSIKEYAKGGDQFFNCSDGGLIKGAKPMHPASLNLPEPAQPKAQTVKAFIESFAIYTQENFHDKWSQANLLEEIPKYAQYLIAAFDNNPDLRTRDYMYEIMPSLTRVSGTSLLMRGTVFLYLMGVEFLLNRTNDEERQQELMDIAIEEGKAMIQALSDEAVEKFSKLEPAE
jgi:hypothetical protein